MFVQVLILQSYNISGMLRTAPLTRQRGHWGREDICLWEDFLWQCGSARQSPGSSGLGIQCLSPVNIIPGVNIARDIETVRVVIMIASGRCQCRHLGLVL